MRSYNRRKLKLADESRGEAGDWYFRRRENRTDRVVFSSSTSCSPALSSAPKGRTSSSSRRVTHSLFRNRPGTNWKAHHTKREQRRSPLLHKRRLSQRFRNSHQATTDQDLFAREEDQRRRAPRMDGWSIQQEEPPRTSESPESHPHRTMLSGGSSTSNQRDSREREKESRRQLKRGGSHNCALSRRFLRSPLLSLFKRRAAASIPLEAANFESEAAIDAEFQ